MKKVLFSFSLCAILFPSLGQTILNGNFENYNGVGCNYNIKDIDFGSKMPNVFAFGKGFASGYVGETDIQTFGCYITPQNGNWSIGLASDSAATADAVALELSSDLKIGETYNLSFYVYGNSNFQNIATDLLIGLSSNDSTFGTFIFKAIPVLDEWKNFSFNFTVSESARFITVTNKTRQKGWNQVDNFVLSSTVTGISDNSNLEKRSYFYPNPFIYTTTLKSDLSLKEATIFIYDVFGQIVRRINNVTGNTFTLNREDLPSGQYVVYVIENEKVVMSNKLVILP